VVAPNLPTITEEDRSYFGCNHSCYRWLVRESGLEWDGMNNGDYVTAGDAREAARFAWYASFYAEDDWHRLCLQAFAAFLFQSSGFWVW